MLEQLVEGLVVVARVVDDAGGHLGREAVRGDEVLAPDVDRVDSQLGRDLVERDLDHVRGLRPARAPDRIRGALVREHADDVGLHSGIA